MSLYTVSFVNKWEIPSIWMLIFHRMKKEKCCCYKFYYGCHGHHAADVFKGGIVLELTRQNDLNLIILPFVSMGSIMGVMYLWRQVCNLKWIQKRPMRLHLTRYETQSLSSRWFKRWRRQKGLDQVGQAIQVQDELQKHRNISSERAQNLWVIMPKILR